MNSNLKRPYFAPDDADYATKRKRLKHSTTDQIKKLLNSTKGEVIQALYMVFDNGSFTFETNYCSNLTNKFICFLNLEGYSFIGYGINKTAAKSAASKMALTYLIHDFKNYCDQQSVIDLITDPCSYIREDVNFSDLICGLVLQKYNDLKFEHKYDLPWYKMIAGIVMMDGNDINGAKVVAMSTGSKCVDKQHIKSDGTVIMDSHAEILSRRALRYFFYNNLELIFSANDTHESIFESVRNSTKYRLRENIKFYLFVNSAPCGDCRIFTLSGDERDKHPNRTSRGLLRIKLDGGSSTVPINNFEKYESEGRFMVMSCSDKLMKMNVLGVQGSLLSYFLEPIYFTGIVIGDLFHETHVIRGLYGRMEGNFEEEFFLNKISVSGVQKELKIATKSPKTNINWILEEPIEILNSVSGKTTTRVKSRLSKYSLFEKFLKLYCDRNVEKHEHYFYDYFKVNAYSYQKSKQCFIRILENKKLGKWIDRKPSLDNFQIFPRFCS